MLQFILQPINNNKALYTIIVLVLMLPLISSCAIKSNIRPSKTKDPHQHYRSVPTVKAWEVTRNRPRYMSAEDVNVSLHPERRLGPTGFVASGYDRKQQIQGIFRGVCEPIMTINIRLQDWRLFDFTAYEKSGDSKFLPINNTLTAMRDVLKVQCPELRGFKVKALVMHKRAPQYEGHMLASNGWQLEKGLPKTGFGDDHRITIALTTSFAGSDGLMIKHNAKCEKQASLHIKRYFLNNTQRAFPKKLYLNDFTRIAKAATRQYVKECTNVQIIRFRVDPRILPAGYTCTKPSECFVARKEHKWSVSGNAITKVAPGAPRKKLCLTKTFCNYQGGDVLNAIYEGNFAHFQKLDREYTKGFDDFLKSLRSGNPILDNMYKRKSIVHSVINEYMFQYKSSSAKCLRSKYKTLVFERRGSDIVLKNMYGTEVHRIPGTDLRSSYTVNKEFVPICKKVGSAVGGSSLVHEAGDAWFNKAMRTRVLHGVKNMMNTEPCNSPQIQQFENNLRSFYRRIHG